MKSMEAVQKTHSESQTMELNEVNGSGAEGTLGEPDDGRMQRERIVDNCLHILRKWSFVLFFAIKRQLVYIQ